MHRIPLVDDEPNILSARLSLIYCYRLPLCQGNPVLLS